MKKGDKSRKTWGVNLVGLRFGRLHVHERVWLKCEKWGYRCVCDCGNEISTLGPSLRYGRTRSCGCFKREELSRTKRTHGRSKSHDYMIWGSMWGRCRDESNTSYKWYGARGITVCERWKSFETFMVDMGPRPDGYSIERRDNDQPYEPSNCFWLPKNEQTRNRRINIHITRDGVTKPLATWASELGLERSMVYSRIHRGWDPSRYLMPRGTSRLPKAGEV